jgi:N utilization substance protein B
MGMRRKARELAVQTLYALDFAEIGTEFKEYDLLNQYPEILDQLARRESIDASSPVFAFAEELIKNTIINLDDLEAEIGKHSENWSVDSIAHLDRHILQIATYELIHTDTPPAVVINEAIEIAKKFCSEGSGGFLNGILDSVKKDLQETALGRGLG